MKNALLGIGAGVWVVAGGHLAASKYQHYQQLHKPAQTVAVSQYKASQRALQAEQAQYKVLATNHAAVCSGLKVKPKGC